jgi:hypothetical protein
MHSKHDLGSKIKFYMNLLDFFLKECAKEWQDIIWQHEFSMEFIDLEGVPHKHKYNEKIGAPMACHIYNYCKVQMHYYYYIFNPFLLKILLLTSFLLKKSNLGKT